MGKSNTVTVTVIPETSGLSVTEGMQIQGKQGAQGGTSVGPRIKRG